MNVKLTDQEKFAIEILNMIEGTNRTIAVTNKNIKETSIIIEGTSKKIEACNKEIKSLLIDLLGASQPIKSKVEISFHVLSGAARLTNNNQN